MRPNTSMKSDGPKGSGDRERHNASTRMPGEAREGMCHTLAASAAGRKPRPSRLTWAFGREAPARSQEEAMKHDLPRFERYVAIGDSSTEGIDDPDGEGGYRGWANRLAQRIADAQGAVLYANLGIRGRLTREILDEQLAPALAMNPGLATVFAGSNDILRMRFDALRVSDDVAHMQRSLAAGGATVVTFTLPDLTPILPMARVLAPRVRALNDALRSASASTGAILVDFAAHAIGSDPRLWSEDRFHANTDGHVRIANA